MHSNPLRDYFLSEKGDSTVVFMCALVLLMMAFFAVLNSLSVKDKKRSVSHLCSVTENLGVLPGGIQLDKGKDFLLASPPIMEAANELVSKGISSEALYNLMISRQGKKWYQPSLTAERTAYHGNEWFPFITLKKSNEGLNISLSDQSFFTSGTADLQPEKLAVLDKISALIKDSSCDVLIKGHTDDTWLRRADMDGSPAGSRTGSFPLPAFGVLNRGGYASIGKPRFMPISTSPTEEFAIIEDAVIKALLTKTEGQSDEGGSMPVSEKLQTIEIYANNKFAQILFPAQILFEKNNAEILPQMTRQLEGIAELLKKFAHPVRINGYSQRNAPHRQGGLPLTCALLSRWPEGRGEGVRGHVQASTTRACSDGDKYIDHPHPASPLGGGDKVGRGSCA